MIVSVKVGVCKLQTHQLATWLPDLKRPGHSGKKPCQKQCDQHYKSVSGNPGSNNILTEAIWQPSKWRLVSLSLAMEGGGGQDSPLFISE